MKTEWLILADHADIVGNKLYVNGGGWNILTVNTGFPAIQQCGIAAAFDVPWNETNQRHTVELEIVSGDGVSLAKAGAQLEIGRPPGLPVGQSQRAQLAMNLQLQLAAAGTYEIIARIEGQEETRTHFNVIPGPMLQMIRQQQPPPPTPE